MKGGDEINIILYSNGCPRCGLLKQMLDSKGVVYTENNSITEMLSIGIEFVPVLCVDGERMGYDDAVRWTELYHKEACE